MANYILFYFVTYVIQKVVLHFAGSQCLCSRSVEMLVVEGHETLVYFLNFKIDSHQNLTTNCRWFFFNRIDFLYFLFFRFVNIVYVFNDKVESDILLTLV